MNWDNEIEKLKNYIFIDKLSYEEVGRLYGCSGSNIKKVMKRRKIELPIRSKNVGKEPANKNKKTKKYCLYCGKQISQKNKYCSLICKHNYEYDQYIIRWKAGEESGINGDYGISRFLRRYLFEKYQCKCSNCGWSKENPYTHKIPLEIEHIDGNFQNNSEENLTLLCPNCHSLTSTYKGANKGKGRKSRKKYY